MPTPVENITADVVSKAPPRLISTMLPAICIPPMT